MEVTLASISDPSASSLSLSFIKLSTDSSGIRVVDPYWPNIGMDEDEKDEMGDEGGLWDDTDDDEDEEDDDEDMYDFDMDEEEDDDMGGIFF